MDNAIDLLSARSVFTGEPSGRPLEPQIGRVLTTCEVCARPTSCGDTLCARCSKVDVIRVRRLSRLDGTYAVTWRFEHSGFETTTIVAVEWVDGECRVEAGESATADVEAAIAEHMIDEDDQDFRFRLAAAGGR